MITEKTGFIIGAGASATFGLPTGKELIQKIIQLENDKDFKESLVRSATDYAGSYFFGDLSSSLANSIDSFLNRRKKSYRDIGKKSITYILNREESKYYKSIFCDEPQKNQGNWLKYLYNQMISGLQNDDPISGFENNKLLFCNFNYDRLLEYGLITAFRKTFAESKKAENVLRTSYADLEKQIFGEKIYHVYGKIADLDSNRMEDEERQSKYCFTNEIRLMEERDIDKTNIINDLNSCKRIFLLGYGFNDENNKLLKLDEICAMNKYKEIFATGYGLLDEEIAVIKHNLKNEYMRIEKDCDCLTLLRKYLNPNGYNYYKNNYSIISASEKYWKDFDNNQSIN